MYRLLAFDYDGTAAVDGQFPTERVCQAIAAARAKGVVAVLATGRPYDSAARYGEALGLDAPVICFQGAMVRELAGEKRVLYVEPAPADAMCEVLALADERDLELNIYGEDQMYIIQRGRPLEFYERWFGMPIMMASSYAEICNEFAATGRSPLKGLFIGPAETNDAFRDELRERFAGRLEVVRSHDLFVEVHSTEASKGHGLKFLADYYDIPQAETIAVGDSGNDSSMIEWAGLGVAMANALPEVFAAADAVAPAVTEDGLADVIERYILAAGGPTGGSEAATAFEAAVAFLRSGELVAFPTDTVYGVGAICWDEAAVARLYTAKLRSLDKAIPILLADPADLALVAEHLPPAGMKLAEAFWPGPLTLVVPKAPPRSR